jgi:phosphoglycerate dehydrogenase-like enzyme
MIFDFLRFHQKSGTKMHIGILPKSTSAIQALQKELAGHHLSFTHTKKKLIAEAESLEILVTGSMGYPHCFVDQAVLERADHLKLIQQFGVATDVVDLKKATGLNIPVAIVPGLNAVAVAELGIYFIFALTKKIGLVDQAIKEGRLGEPIGTEVYGKTLGIVGLGRIGTALALRAKCLGMRVISVKRSSSHGLNKTFGIESVETSDCLSSLLKNSDYVVLTLPLDAQTTGLIGAEELKTMKPGAYLINLSRGPMIDRYALIQALKSERLAGFATDAAWEEPANPDDWIFRQQNVILTPHIGATTIEVLENTAKVVKENVERVAIGVEPLYVVNEIRRV